MPLSDRHFPSWVEGFPSLSGKVVAITGTTSGTGYWAAVATLRKGAKALLLLNRESTRSKEGLEKLKDEKQKISSSTELIPVNCDLMSFDAVRKAAAEVNEICDQFGGLNVLMNNAGIMAFPDKRTDDGYEVQMQVNHLSHFLLTKLVMPSLVKAYNAGEEVRVCQHSSLARKIFGKDLEKQYFEKSKPGTLGGDSVNQKFKRYHMTKLSNVLFALALHKRLQEKGYDTTRFKSVVAEPGTSETSLAQNTVNSGRNILLSIFNTLFNYVVKYVASVQSAADGSLPLLEASLGKNVDSADFFYPKQKAVGIPYKAISKGELSEGNKTEEDLCLDEKNQELAWKLSEEICGPFFES